MFILNACASKEKEVSIIKETKQDLEMVAAYKEGYEALEKGDPYFAANKFLESELMYPQSEWASKSALMASYSYYMQNYYPEAISNLERYLKTYPTDKNIAYAHYLIAMCYYETIEDEKRDLIEKWQRLKLSFMMISQTKEDFYGLIKQEFGYIWDDQGRFKEVQY